MQQWRKMIYCSLEPAAFLEPFSLSLSLSFTHALSSKNTNSHCAAHLLNGVPDITLSGHIIFMTHFSNSPLWHQNKSGRRANYSTPTSKITGGEGERVTERRKEVTGWERERERWGGRYVGNSKRVKMRSQEVSISNQRFYCFCY